MDHNHVHHNDSSHLSANALAAILVKRMNAVLNSGAPRVLPVKDDPYLTPAVLEAYERLVVAANDPESAGETMEFAMSVQEGGRLLQLVIEGAMAHARGHGGGEPWFTCSTGLGAVRLAVGVFAGLVDKVEWQ